MSKFFGGIFNWWIGVFYGVMPSSFTYGHSINHHKYNNGPNDVVSSADKPRDNFLLFVAYVPRFFFYAINVSTVHQFWIEGLYLIAGKVFCCCCCCCFFFFVFFFVNTLLIKDGLTVAALLDAAGFVVLGQLCVLLCVLFAFFCRLVSALPNV